MFPLRCACAIPQDNLCIVISFSRTSDIPNLILHTYRITLLTIGTLHWWAWERFFAPGSHRGFSQKNFRGLKVVKFVFPTRQWCRKRGSRGCKCTPKHFDYLKIWAKSPKIWAKSLKIRTKPPNFLKKSLKIWAKMAPNVALLQKIVPQRLQENKWRPFFKKSH